MTTGINRVYKSVTPNKSYPVNDRRVLQRRRLVSATLLVDDSQDLSVLLRTQPRTVKAHDVTNAYLANQIADSRARGGMRSLTLRVFPFPAVLLEGTEVTPSR